MNRHALAKAAILVAACCCQGGEAADPALSGNAVPPHLVGVWVADGAVLRGEALFEGQAIYLDTDGIGAIVGGAPPIGVRIVAKLDPSTNVIAMTLEPSTSRATSKGAPR